MRARRRVPTTTSNAYSCKLPFCTRPSTPAVRWPSAAMPFERTVEQRLVAEAKEDTIRNPIQRPADQTIVGFVDEVLAGEHAVHAGERVLQPSGPLGAAAEQQRGADEPQQRQRDRHEHERRLEVREPGGRLRYRQQWFEIMRNRQEAADRRQHGQHDEDPGHRRRRFVDMVCGFRAHSRPTEKGEPQEAEHVERREQRGSGRHGVEQRRAATTAGKRKPEDFVLGEEARKRRNAGDGGGRHGECNERHRNLARQATHFPDVLFAAHGMDHAAGGQEQARLEKGVGIEMENGDAVSSDSQRDEHEAELGNGRVREHLLDVGLHDRDRRREKSRERAHRSNDGAGLGRMQIDAGKPSHQIHAGSHHRRRMNQRGHRRRSRHRIR